MSIYVDVLTGGSNNHEATSEVANVHATDFFNKGVVGAKTNTSGVAPATGAYAVNAQGTPNMTVAVSAGVAYVTATPSGQASQLLRVYNNASANVTIAANSSGSTKYDWVYISISAANAADPSVAADNVATLVTSRSSNANSDDGTPPTYGLLLAVVTVANGASSITNGNIADKRVNVIPKKATRNEQSTNVDSGSITSNTYQSYSSPLTVSITTLNANAKVEVNWSADLVYANVGGSCYGQISFSGANSGTGFERQATNGAGSERIPASCSQIFTLATAGTTTFELKCRGSATAISKHEDAVLSVKVLEDQ